MSVKIIIDSASDINQKEAEQLGITMIPMSITFGDNEYYDGVDLLPNDFYAKLIESSELPKTSQINAFRWEELFEKELKNADELVVITMSSKLSATHNSAVQAANKFKDKVFVVDSMNVATGERLLCQYALRLVKEGLSAQDIAKKLDDEKSRIKIVALVGTLDYLRKGGRISSAVAFAGKLLAIKPVVAVEDGKVKVVGKAMGSKNGNNMLNKMIAEQGGIDFEMPLGVLWSGLDKTMLDKYVEDSSHLWKDKTDKLNEYIIGSTIGTHVGPGAVGVAFFGNKK